MLNRFLQSLRVLAVIFSFLILAASVSVQGQDFDHGSASIRVHLDILNSAVRTRNAAIQGLSGLTTGERAAALQRIQADFTRTVEQAKLPPVPAAASVCRNGVVETGEVCDNTAFGARTCSSETNGARPSGALSCAADCHSIDSSRCTAPSPPPPACTVDTWTCTNWGVCGDNRQQTGTCTSLNDCPTASNPSPSPRACTPVTYILTVGKYSNSNGSGTVTGDVSGRIGSPINCGGLCSDDYLQGRVVTLTATAAPGSTFANWSGNACNGSTANTCAVTMDNAKTITATFNTACTPTTCAAQGKNCDLISNGCGGTLNCGSCTSLQSCGGGGTANVCGTPPFDFNLSTNPASIGVINGLGTASVTVTQTVGNPAPVALSVSGCPSGASCSFSATSVTSPNSSILSLNWPATLPAASGFFTIIGSGGGVTKTQLVNFAVLSTLTVNKSGSGAGLVASSPAGIYCTTASCSANFPSGNVTLTATATTGLVFAGWSGDCSGTGSCIVNMSSNRTVIATFNPACTPLTQAQACSNVGKNCGTVSDGCGSTLNCGACTAPQSCGGGGTANVCGCTPDATAITCAGKACGPAINNCGTSITCPNTCTSPNTCGGGGVGPNACGCTPKTAAQACLNGQNCGTASNGCGSTVSCGSCASPKICNTAKVCTYCGNGIYESAYEDCDAGQFKYTCASTSKPYGNVSCTSSCTIDYSQCTSSCTPNCSSAYKYSCGTSFPNGCGGSCPGTLCPTNYSCSLVDTEYQCVVNKSF